MESDRIYTEIERTVMVSRLDHERVDVRDDDGDLVIVSAAAPSHELGEEFALRRDDDPVAVERPRVLWRDDVDVI